ncbi:CAP domain-containing protein [Georgenia sp. 10Sc9-8]|uniref:CAP domain-containing protein n=1 Tax=Georgenia halotolerans TaxID=3028317 RepID=A0ABT5TY89_9MICO|nr:CAP domain-containing protein [Georgenia halotolerans]
MDETNRAREAEGLDPLPLSECAARAGRHRAAELVGQALEHAPLKDVIADCAPHGRAAENLVDSEAAPAAVVEAWLDSPGHRSNVLAPDMTAMGIGCVEHTGGMLCSQIFVGP